jgi:hypothetical protein
MQIAVSDQRLPQQTANMYMAISCSVAQCYDVEPVDVESTLPTEIQPSNAVTHYGSGAICHSYDDPSRDKHVELIKLA